FKNHVPHESVTHNYVRHLIGEEVVAFDIAPEVNFIGFIQELMCSFHCTRSLGFLLSYVEEADRGFFYSKHVFCIYTAKHPVLEQNVRFAVRIDSDIKYD